MNFVNRLNQKAPPIRVAVPSGHDPYERGPVTNPTDPRWQLPVCKPEGPEHDMLILQAHLAAAQRALEAAERAEIELDPDRLTSTRKRRTVGKSGIPPQEAA
jgi:hypothetical protein